ncbi:DUF6603 domain-containing protein [Mycolicibacterium monacense]|uniref:DUF6603 domain-containing protein n=1 Tax=Mycolicibacterium monacense TaxID=85693 RepID=UPI001F18BD7F|nr:DUF6603 domain-containing protein [Mycolicibacterium monacense]
MASTVIHYIAITGSPSSQRLMNQPGLYLVATTPAPSGGWMILAYADEVARQALTQNGFRFETLEDDRASDARFAMSASQVLGGPPVPEAVRSDIAVELLLRALDYLRGRLNRVVLEIMQSADVLAAQLALPVDEAAYDALIAAIDRFSTAVDVGFEPRTIDFTKAASASLAGVVSAAKTAVGLEGLRKIVRRVLDAGSVSGEFADLLGLAGSQASVVTGASSVELKVAAGDVSLLGIVSVGEVALAGDFRYSGAPQLGLTLRLQDLRMVDSAAGSLTAALGLADATGSVSLRIDTADGFTVNGGARGERISLVPPKSKGPVRITSLMLDVVPTGTRLFVALTSSVQGSIGSPLTLTAKNLGVRFEIDPLGDRLVREASLKTPDGFGIALDAGPVRGGGFLERVPVPGHPDWTRYSGALALRIGPVAVTGFAVLTDRPDGFSFAVSISVQISPPVELGLLFTLNGVGGIVGANVSADTRALAAGVGDGTISRLLFPDDPARAAPAILETLATVFPVHEGGFVIGPMVKLGWGRPVSFVTAEVALILSLPDPKILVLGRLRIAIPADFAPIIDLKAEIYGEFSGDRVLILASLIDSRIGFFTVAGQFGMLLRLGADPTFVLSAGGFHPRYQPPGELANLRRISAEISPPAFHLRLEAYAAITTNTVQFGGALDVRYGIDGTGVYGTAALDALIQFDPFGFQADLMAGVSVRVLDITLLAITLRLHLEGPAPWKAWGTGEVVLPWPLPDISIDVGPVTWGGKQPAPAPVVSARSMVVDALSRPQAWSATTAAGQYGVALAAADPGAGILIDPWSQLSATQSAVPLDVDIVRIGASRLADGERRVVLGPVTIAQQLALGYSAETATLTGEFASGQYLDLSDDDVLRRPSFENMPAGIQIDPRDADLVPGVVWVQPHYVTSFPHHDTGGFLDSVEAAAVSGLAVAATAAGSSVARTRYATAGSDLSIAHPGQMVVVSANTLQAVPGGPATAMTFTLAEQQLTALGATAVQLMALGGAG